MAAGATHLHATAAAAKWLAVMLAVCCCYAPPAARALSVVRQLSACSVLTDAGTVDLSPLSRSGSSPRFSKIASKSYPTAVSYDWNPCNDFSEPGSDPAMLCQQVAMCAVLPQSTNERALDATYIPYGSQNSANFTVFGGQLALRYTDATVSTEAVIVIQCSTAGGDSFTSTNDDNYQSIQFTYSGPSGCFTTKGSSLSTGTILCIVLLVCFATYFAVGTLFVKFVKKTEQKVPIPNSEFWSQLPVFVKDGFKYSTMICRKRRSGYENV